MEALCIIKQLKRESQKKSVIVGKFLEILGLTPTLNGFYPLCDILVIMDSINSQEREAMLNFAYSRIAQSYCMNTTTLENKIQQCIDYCFEHGNAKILQSVFGYGLSNNKISNLDFINCILGVIHVI